MGPKGKKKKDDDKKDKKNEADIPEEVLVSTTDLEQEPEEVQFTDTSYTSASFETLPPPPEEPKTKPKRKKKRAEEEIKKQSSELFQWSEESLPQEEDEEEKKPEPVALEVKKKKEKGKKKGKKEDEIPSFEKPKNWKNMDKKARDAWMALRIEEWREEQEAAKQAAIAGAKEKRARLAKERAELMVKDNAEQEIRRDILEKTCALFQGYEDQKRDYDNVKQRSEEWAQYLRCDGLPDPRVVTQMSTYLHMWRDRATYDDNELQKKCLEVLPMLDMLEEFVANARQYTERQAHNYNEVRLQLRAQLSTAIEFASYHLLRDIEKRLTRESIKLSTYGRQFEGLKLTLWVAVKMPTRLPKAVEPHPEPVELAFPSINVTLKLPTIIDASCICVRASRSMIDLVSEKSKTFALAREVPNRYEDLFTFCEKEHAETFKLKKEQDVIRTTFYRQLRERVRELEALLKSNVYAQFTKEKEELEELSLAEPPFLPDPRTFIGEQNERIFKKFLKACNLRTKTGELNLRKYRICGGVLNLDLLMTPPEPKRMRWEVELSTLELPKQLKPIDYKVQYRTPSPPGPGVTRTPEEIEAEMKKIEAEYEKLALVSIDLPNEVMWFEPPVICQWQEPRKLWTSNYVNDYKYNEDKLTVQFRTGVLWPIGIATLKYSNLPYQGWDMRPAPKGQGVLITVTGICATVSWLCSGSTVKLMRNVVTPALKEHFNKKYSVKRMVQIMREAAVDFFPDFDAYNYVEGSCHKEWVAERHNYHAMAFLSRAYNFQWSRWNAGAGSRNNIMQIREAVDPKREAKLSLLCASPTRAYIMKCNEMSQEFDFDPMPGMLFYPDLFTMNMTYGSVDARRHTFGQKFKLVESVFGMLQELKLSSFS